MMPTLDKYVVIMKSPGRNGPVLATKAGSYISRDVEKYNRLVESAERKIIALSGSKPDWNKAKEIFITDLTPDQAKEMSAWIGVKKVMLYEDYTKLPL